MSDRSVIWTPLGWPGAEHLVLRERPDGWLAEGHVVGVEDPAATAAPYTVRYVVRCDERWRVRQVDVSVVTAEGVRTLELRADGAGHWTDGVGAPPATAVAEEGDRKPRALNPGGGMRLRLRTIPTPLVHAVTDGILAA